MRVYTWTSFSVDPDGYVQVGADSVLVGARLMCAERIEIGRDVVISYDATIADCDFHPLDPEERRRDAVAISPRAIPGARRSSPRRWRSRTARGWGSGRWC